MNRLIRSASISAMVLTLGACQILPETPPPPSEHDLGKLTDFAPSKQLPATVVLSGIDAPSWLQGREIRYRLMHRHPSRIHAYARHQWVAPPPELIERYLGQRLALATPPAATAEQRPWQLHLSLDAFEQTFDGDRRSHAVIQFRAILRSPAGNSSGRKSFIRRQSTEPDIDGALSGLAAVTNHAAAELEEWLEKRMQPRD